MANQLFTLELARRAEAKGIDLLSVAAHPGYAATNLQAVGPQMSGSTVMERIGRFGNSLVAQSAAAGALPSLYGATAPGVRSGQYFGPNRLFGLRGYPGPASFVRAARDVDAARRLWDVSEGAHRVKFALLDAST